MSYNQYNTYLGSECMSYNQINKYLGSGKYHYSSLCGSECDPFEMYCDVFNNGEDLQDKDNSYDNRYNLLALYKTQKKDNTNRKFNHIWVHKGLTELKEIINNYDNIFYMMSPNSYIGYNASIKNLRNVYALVIDIDNITTSEKIEDLGLYHLDGYINAKWYLKPNYIVSSGHGIHLYYIFREPLRMWDKLYHNILFDVKNAYIDRIWNEDLSNKTTEHGSIVQNFRIGGTLTKNGIKNKNNEIARCFHFCNERYTLSDFANVCNDYLNERQKNLCNLITNHLDNDIQHYKLEELKIINPKWYHERIELKQPKKEIEIKKWNVSENVYKWWFNKYKSIKVGQRYYFCYFLVVYANKCNIPKERVKKDIDFLYNQFKLISKNKEPFTKQDARDALNAYEDDKYLWTIKKISHFSKIYIIPNKRNGRKRKQHIEYMNFCKKEKPYNCNGGRPKKEKIIIDYLLKNNNATIKDIVYECNVSKPSAIKYRKLYKEKALN